MLPDSLSTAREPRHRAGRARWNGLAADRNGGHGPPYGCGRGAQTERRTPSRRHTRGLTLIEVMVVVVILGILAALIVPSVISRPDDARLVAAKQDIATIVQALKLYRLDNHRYPSAEQGLQALVAPPTLPPPAPNWKSGGYLERLPKDPWGNAYLYLNPGVRGEIDVFSYGADGAQGGNARDADIGSWDL
jgi:general secretion pathway protein G